MVLRLFILFSFVGAVALSAAGCASDSSTTRPATSQRSLIKGLGDVARASIERKQRLISAVVNAGGSLLVGARHEKVESGAVDEALAASARAERSPAKADDVTKAASTPTTADLNGDGFVTLDEVVAMKRAGLSTQTMIDRLRGTDQVFELADWQEKYLRDRGVDVAVIDAMRTMKHS